MKNMLRKALAALLTLIIVISLFPATANAYVGAMTKDIGGVTCGQQDGYYYITNNYIGFYIRPDGNLSTVPSQKTLSDVKNMGATETHVFYKQTGVEIWHTDSSTAISPSSRSVTTDSTDPANPKLKQTLAFSFSGYQMSMTITYQLVQLHQGASTGTTGRIVEKDSADNGRTWGVMATASLDNSTNPDTRLLWMSRHNSFGHVGHSLQGNIRLDRYTTTYDNNHEPTTTHYSGPISSGLAREEAENISEAFTDSFTYANQFVAINGYMRAMGYSWDETESTWVGTLISGIRGHEDNYGSAVSYLPSTSQLNMEHQFSGDNIAQALWGFRDLYASGESENIPADPVSIARDANCIGIINNNGTMLAQAAKNEAELKTIYGSKLVAVFRGAFKQESGNFIFTDGAAQLSPAVTATWTVGSGQLSVAANGQITAKGVHLSAPTFKFYQPRNSSDTSLNFGFGDGKLAVNITPGNNAAILHIDIPGATCRVESVTADLSGGLIFSGEISISTPAIEAMNVTMTRRGMGWSNKVFSLTGLEASVAVDMKQLRGLDVAKASAEINSFPGEERYAFELELNVFEMFEAKGELELTRIFNGALIPNTLKLRGASEVGVPLVPPVVVAEFNGLGGGFENLATTINGDFFAIPPLRLTVSAKGSVLEIIEGWYTIIVGAGYYQASLTDGTLLEMDIIDEYSWYTELCGDMRSYGGTSYQGLKLGGGMKIDLVIPDSTMPFVNAGGEFNASAFAGLDNYTNPTRAYLLLGADGKIYGLVQIPASAWFINRDLKLAAAEVAFALGGQTTVGVNHTTFENAVKEAFGNISGYGGVAYTGNLIGFPFRIYYIFQNKNVGMEVGEWFGELEPFNPIPFSLNKLSLLDEDTGEQVGIMVMNDNLTLLGSSRNEISPLSVGSNFAADNGVSITQTDQSQQSYQVVIGDTAPNTSYLAFSLTPDENWDGTPESFMSNLTVQKSGESSALEFVAAAFNSDNQISNNDAANLIVGEDCLTLMLPSKGTWELSSTAATFDISCYYARPYASLSGMSLSGTTLTGTAENANNETDYILRTYLGTEKGVTDYLLCQSNLPSNGIIDETLALSGSSAPTGSYFVTTLLLEEVNDDFDGAGSDWTKTGANYLLKASDLTPAPDGYYTYEMAVTVGDETLHLDADKTYKVGITAFRYLADEDSDGKVDSFPLESSEVQSDGKYLPEATYPVLTYSPVPWSHGDTMKLLNIKEVTEITVSSDVPADIIVTRMDKREVIKQTSSPDTSISFSTPADFTGALNIKITATDEEGDIAVDYLGLRLDESAPLITLDNDSFKANQNTGAFMVSGVTESCAKVMANETITDDYSSGVELDADQVTADEKGIFTMTGKLNPEDTANELVAADSATIILCARDAANNVSASTFAQIVRASKQQTIPVTGITLNKGTLSLAVGAEETLTATVEPAGASNKNVTWSSSDGTVATVGTDGKVTAVAAGTATITVTTEDGGKTAACNVTVSSATIGTGGRSYSYSSTHIKASPSGSISADSLKTAALAAKQGGTVTVQTTGSSVKVTGEGLQYLINKNLDLSLTTGSGTMLISAEVLAGLEISSNSQVEFVLSRTEILDDPELQTLANAGYPVYQIAILIDGKAVHNLAGTIAITLKDSSFIAMNDLKVIHALDSGVYRDVAYTLDDVALSFGLDTLSYVCVLDGDRASQLKNPFTDVTLSDWFFDNVLFAYKAGLLLGTASDTFSPKLGMTRAMIITVLHRMSGDAGNYQNIFADVTSTAWYADAVAWAEAKDISKGVGNNRFAPNTKITREQLAVMLYRYAEYMGYDVSVGQDTNILSYNDAFEISDYAYPALQWACGSGIMNGDNGGNLNPQGFANRAEAAAMLQRFIETMTD